MSQSSSNCTSSPSSNHYSISSTSSPESADARRFVRSLLIFSIPFWIYGLFIVSTDPFNYFGASRMIPDELKLETAGLLDPCFWKMNQFNAAPVANVLLGDSRMAGFRSDTIKQITGLEYFNFAYGGGTLTEVIDTFWFAASRTSLKSVYIGVNLNLYNDYANTRRTQLFDSVSADPVLYFTSRTVLQSASYALYSWLSHTRLVLGAPALSREAFWQNQLGEVTAAVYSPFMHPTRYLNELQRIADYSHARQIELVFVIFPTHVDLQNRVHDFHLETESASLRTDLGLMAPTHDFDYPNGITTPRENFSDPYHVKASIDDILIRELWMGPQEYAHLYLPKMQTN